MVARLLLLYRRIFWTHEQFAVKMGVKIGENCRIGTRDFGSEPYLVEIGNNVQITAGVKFFTHGGSFLLRQKYPDFDFFGKIKVKNNVYIGNNVLIMPGVIIESNVIIGAGSIVTKSFPEGVIIGGNPAKIIGDIVSFESKILKYNLHSKGMNYQEKKKFLLSLSDDKFIQR